MAKTNQSEAGMSTVDLVARLSAILGSSEPEERRDGLWISAPQLDVEAMAREMKSLGYRLITLTGCAQTDGETAVLYHYARREQYVTFKTSSRGGALPSITPILRMASWPEREIHDLFALKFTGHPNLVPLLRPPGVKEGFFRDNEPTSATQG